MKQRAMGQAVELTDVEIAVLREVDDILSDGFWDDPQEPGHAASRKAWRSIMLKLSKRGAS